MNAIYVYIWCFACMFVCLLYGYYAHGGQKRASLGPELQNYCKPLCRCWKSNLG